jgi:hypothetical protein
VGNVLAAMDGGNTMFFPTLVVNTIKVNESTITYFGRSMLGTLADLRTVFNNFLTPRLGIPMFWAELMLVTPLEMQKDFYWNIPPLPYSLVMSQQLTAVSAQYDDLTGYSIEFSGTSNNLFQGQWWVDNNVFAPRF